MVGRGVVGIIDGESPIAVEVEVDVQPRAPLGSWSSGYEAAEQNGPAVSSALVEMNERFGRCWVAASRDAGQQSSRRDATKLVLGIEMTEKPCDDYREASLPIGGGVDHTHGLCLCGWLKEEHGQDRR
jgi:hypothetical protein